MYTSFLAQRIEDVQVEMHQISLIRGAFHFSSSERASGQHQVNLGLSADENLAIFCHRLSLDMTEAGPKRASTQKVAELLLHHKPFECTEQDITDLWKTFDDVPVGFCTGLYDILPTDLINAVPYHTVVSAQCMMYEPPIPKLCPILRLTPSSKMTYQEMPHLRAVENHLSLLLYQCVISHVDDKTLLEWMTSARGKHHYQRLMVGLGELQTPDQIVLRLTVLLSYELVIGRQNEVLEPVHGSYLRDFLYFLEGHEVRN
ncbi:hypothetical protein CEP54_001338 [Fusarium duplospermum]|uniref:Uncharacterized protein n=1 Tax=Fusarium duplospermum TaxID=1325734 RepID=A0A428R1K2_9HYPO|nr:hypothetical protein CEP54_001338 [Fusarium duplospermum]